MAKANKVQETAQTQEKVLTKYDKKVQRRKEEEKKEKKNKKIAKIIGCAVAVCAVIGIGAAVWNNYNKVHTEYISVGDEKISQIDFDFYYAMSKQDMLNQTLYGAMTYQSYFESYMGYDSSVSDKKQKYTQSDNTWYDYFANATVDTIKEYKALNQAADEKNFTYDADAAYQEFTDQVAKSAEEAGQKVSAYYKEQYGSHATEANLKNSIHTYLRAQAYKEQLDTELNVTADEISEYYKEHKDSYDTVDYRVFEIASENGNDEKAMAAAKEKADKMAGSVTDESTFIALCKENATTDQKDTYNEDAASLKTKVAKSSVEQPLADWMFDESRTAGNVTVVEDTENSKYYVAYFVQRSYDNSNDETIAQIVESNKYNELIEGYTSSMKVKNKNNRIKMYTEQ